uniref:Uncharacterized protein n=1 Tax=Romanomermis culicivorax TaxID=13658 RepID=A0A915JY84_ROMCU
MPEDCMANGLVTVALTRIQSVPCARQSWITNLQRKITIDVTNHVTGLGAVHWIYGICHPKI